jgi:proteasome component ECM29
LNIVQHVNRRVRTNGNVALPVATLVDTAQQADAAPMTRSLALMYVEMGFPRLSASDRASLVPALLLAAHRHDAIRVRCLRLAFESIALVPLNRPDATAHWPLAAEPAARAGLLAFAAQLLLASCVSVVRSLPSPGLSMRTYCDLLFATAQRALSLADVAAAAPTDRVELRYESRRLNELKLQIVEFLLHSHLFTNDELLQPLVAAAGASNNLVADAGQSALKRIGNFDIENDASVAALYRLCLGDQPAAVADADERATPADANVQLKSLSFLSRSTLAANCFPLAPNLIRATVWAKRVPLRLRRAGQAFAHHVLATATDEKLQPFASDLMLQLLALCEKQGELFQQRSFGVVTPGAAGSADPDALSMAIDGSSVAATATTTTSEAADVGDEDGAAIVTLSAQDAVELQKFAFQALGRLARRSPAHVIAAGLQVPETLWRTMSESSALHHDADQAMRAILSTFKGAPAPLLDGVLGLLSEMIASKIDAARVVAVWAANELFAFDDVRARRLCFIGAGDLLGAVREQAARGLAPPPSAAYPALSSVAAVWRELCGGATTSRQPAAGVGSSEVIAACAQFAHRALLSAARAAGAASLRAYVAANVAALADVAALCIEAIESRPSVAAKVAAAVLLFELAAVEPALLRGRAEWCARALAQAGERPCNMIGAQLVALASDLLGDDELRALCAKLANDCEQASSVAVAQAALRALALIALRSARAALTLPPMRAALAHYDVRFKEATQSVTRAERVTLLGICACSLPDDAAERDAVLDELFRALKDSDRVVVERAALALGQLALGVAEGAPLRRTLYEKLLATQQLAHIESHFAIGAALATVLGGGAARCVRSMFAPSSLADEAAESERERDGESDEWHEVERDGGGGGGGAAPRIGARELVGADGALIEQCMRELMTRVIAPTASPVSRVSGSVWLLALVKFLAAHPAVRARLRDTHVAFAWMLSDANELAQEVAARGLSLVYELAHDDEATRAALVQTLLRSLSGTPSAAEAHASGSGAKVTADSELLPNGIGEAPQSAGGGKLSTYRELCSMANDIGQPELIYQFLQLSAHSAMWRSKRGAAFAASAILRHARADVGPHLAKLVPRLYRFTHDPNPQTAAAMKRVLRALCDEDDIGAVLTQHFGPIVVELHDACTAREWRVRESACTALADVLLGRRYAAVAAHLESLWLTLLRVIDDVKETVRKAAHSALNALARISVGYARGDGTSSPGDSAAVLALLFPLLLDKGLTSTEPAFAIKQILALSRAAKELLVPHVARIIAVLLQALSSLEPGAFSYLAQHVDELGVTAEQLESARLSALAASPLHESLALCAANVVESNAADVVGELVKLVKRGVGMQTRVAAAQFVDTVCSGPGAEQVRAHTGKLLAALLVAIYDPSPSVRRAMATALGRVTALASAKAAPKVLAALNDGYVGEPQNDDKCLVIALCIGQIARHAPQHMREHTACLYAALLLGPFDRRDDVAEHFRAALTEMGWTTASLCADEADDEAPQSDVRHAATRVLLDGCQASAYSRRAQAFAALEKLAPVCAQQAKVGATYFGRLVDVCERSMRGGFWQGKEAVLDASVAVATECVRAAGAANGDVIPTWLQLWFRECLRDDMTLAYQRHALVQAAKFVEQCAPLLAAQSGGAASARFDAAALVALTMERLGGALLAGWSVDDNATPATSGAATAATTDDVILEQRRTKPARLALAASAFGVLQQLFACNRSVGRVRMASSAVLALLTSALTAPWNIQAAAAQVVAQAASALPASGERNAASALVHALCQLTADSSYAAVRGDAFDALCALAESDVGVLELAAQTTAARARSEGSADDAAHARKLLALLAK